jgi:hypothetical protein
MTRSIFLGAVVVATIFACADREQADGGASADTTVASNELPPDTMPADIPAYTQVDADSIRAKMDSVEALLAKATDAERPRLLFTLGRLKRLFISSQGTLHGRYAAGREDEYWYNELGDNYIYTGKHLKQIIDSFPRHDLADDAAYELTLLPLGGECEGFVTCAIAAEWIHVRDFLARYPTSAYARRALDRALAAYAEYLKDVKDLAVQSEYYDPKELRNLLVEFDSVATRLPPTLKTRADSLSAALWPKLGRASP